MDKLTKRAYGLFSLAFWFLCGIIFAQEGTTDLVTPEERRRAAMMILLLMILGLAMTILFLWILRRRGIVEAPPAEDPLAKIKDEIARQAEDIDKQ